MTVSLRRRKPAPKTQAANGRRPLAKAPTLFAMEFLVHGALQYNEPGVFVSLEETPEELVINSRSLGFDLNKLGARRGDEE